MIQRPLCVSKKWLRHFFEKRDRAEFGPQSTFSTYTPPKKRLNFFRVCRRELLRRAFLTVWEAAG